MAEKTFSGRIAKTSVEEARKKLSNARSDKMKKYWKNILEIRLDAYNNLSKGGVPMKGKTKVAKKMMRGGVATKTSPKRMRGGGMMKAASKKKMMRGGMAKKKK